MLPEKTFNEKIFSMLITHACSALRLTAKQIKEKFHLYPVCVINYYEKEETDYAIEIRFDNEQSTITCLFDTNHRSDSASIFPDHLCLLADYVNYLNSAYEYDYIGCRWILPNGYLYIKKSKSDVCFMISC